MIGVFHFVQAVRCLSDLYDVVKKKGPLCRAICDLRGQIPTGYGWALGGTGALPLRGAEGSAKRADLQQEVALPKISEADIGIASHLAICLQTPLPHTQPALLSRNPFSTSP